MYLVQGTAQEDLPEKQTSSAFLFYLYYYFVVQGSVFMFCPLLSTLLNSHNESQYFEASADVYNQLLSLEREHGGH